MASHLTIIGPAAVEKKGALPVIEVSPEAEGEDPLKPASADRLRGGARRFCEVYRAAGAMATAGGKLFLGEGGRKKVSSPAESASHEKYKSRPAASLTFYIPAQGSTATAAPTFSLTAAIL